MARSADLREIYICADSSSQVSLLYNSSRFLLLLFLIQSQVVTHTYISLSPILSRCTLSSPSLHLPARPCPTAAIPSSTARHSPRPLTLRIQSLTARLSLPRPPRAALVTTSTELAIARKSHRHESSNTIANNPPKLWRLLQLPCSYHNGNALLRIRQLASRCSSYPDQQRARSLLEWCLRMPQRRCLLVRFAYDHHWLLHLRQLAAGCRAHFDEQLLWTLFQRRVCLSLWYVRSDLPGRESVSMESGNNSANSFIGAVCSCPATSMATSTKADTCRK